MTTQKTINQKFKLTEIQANAILDIRLRQLAKLEEQGIIEERDSLKAEAKEIEKILNSASRLKTLIKKRIKRRPGRIWR